MPHFIVDCSASLVTKSTEQQIFKTVFEAARSTGLFEENDIKVRINPYVRCEVGGRQSDFIHVFGYILEGRSDELRAGLSQRIVKALAAIFPDLEFLAASVEVFSLAGYSNRNLIRY